MQRALACTLFALVLPASGVARAQTFNVDGTPSMIPPDGNIFNDNRAPGTGAIGISTVELQPQGPTAPGTSQERFDIDCDPDIEPCVDPDSESAYDDGYDPNAYQQFESALAPYGQWSEDENYGEVWTPSQDTVGGDFEPYASDGQWMASSDYGFTWVSDYNWGWAPFHYGRWIMLDGVGWSWVPGTLWGPAWVDWRYGNGYCGWSPLPPKGIVVPPPGRGTPTHPLWHFTLASEITRRNPSYVPHTVASSIYARTSPVHNARTVTANGVSARITLGPPVAMVSHDIGRPVPTLALKNGAPSVLPRTAIVAHAGVALAQRGYVQRLPTALNRGGATLHGSIQGAGQSVGARPLVQGRGPSPGLNAPHVSAPPSYPPGRMYSSPTTGQPVYRYSGSTYEAPQHSYSQSPSDAPHTSAPSSEQRGYAQPTYVQPERSYAQPTYVQPQRTYTQPTYVQPQRTYTQPQPAPQQSYQAPAPTYHQSVPISAPVSHPASGGGGGAHHH